MATIIRNCHARILATTPEGLLGYTENNAYALTAPSINMPFGEERCGHPLFELTSTFLQCRALRPARTFALQKTYEPQAERKITRWPKQWIQLRLTVLGTLLNRHSRIRRALRSPGASISWKRRLGTHCFWTR